MSLKISVILLLSVLLSPVQAQQSSIYFTIKNAGINVKGTFNKFQLNHKFHPKDLENSFFNLSIPTITLNTANKTRDKHLRKTKYFDVEQYPEIKFASTSVTSTASGLSIKGLLTIKATSKSIEIPVNIEEKEGQRFFIGRLELNRRDYGVGRNHLIMGDKVIVDISIPYSENEN